MFELIKPMKATRNKLKFNKLIKKEKTIMI